MADRYVNETTEEFVRRLTTTADESFKALSIAYGMKTGLFKAMIELHPTPRTPKEIADKAGLKERYVHEWLGSMVCGGIIDIDQDSERYHLPSHRVPAFSEGNAASESAVLCKAIPMMSDAYDAMIEVIKKDGPLGVDYSKYTKFHEYMSDLSMEWFRDHLCQDFVPSLPDLKSDLEKGIRVLDIGCGRGGGALHLATHFPNSYAIGLDVNEEAISYAKEVAKTKGLTNVEYVLADATVMPADWTDTFDYAMAIDVVHDVPRPDLLLTETNRVLKAGGRFSCLEPKLHTRQVDNIGAPYAIATYTISLFHCLPVSAQFPDSLALGGCWGKEEAVQLLEKKGFTILDIQDTKGYNAHFWCIANSK